MFHFPFSLTLFFQAIWYIYINCYFCQLYGLSCLRPVPWRWFQLHKPWPGESTVVMCFVSHLLLLLTALTCRMYCPDSHLFLCKNNDILWAAFVFLAALSCRFFRAYADTLWQMFSAALSYTEVLLSFLFLDFPVIAPLCILYVCLPGELWVMLCCEHCATAEDEYFLHTPDKASECRQKLPLDWWFSSSLCTPLAHVRVRLNTSSVTAFTCFQQECFFYTAKEISQLLYSEQHQCDLLKGDLKVFVYLPMGQERKWCI